MSKSLTDIQKQIIRLNGLVAVKACPGSGKTLTVAARLSDRLQGWEHAHRGIAAISFTNVAWQEIERALSEQFGISGPIRYPHFLGTIDSFVNQYIFLPFGHLVMGCRKRPELVGPPVNNWEPIGNPWPWGSGLCYSRGCKLNHFSYNVDGSIQDFVFKKDVEACPSSVKKCRVLKKRFNSLGYATLLDSTYFAMKVLSEFPEAARALAYRFPVLMVDEAQDTCDRQMKIIELLISGGLNEVMLIGDPYQAIYEWREAKPRLFVEKCTEWDEKMASMNENWRSSQAICDAACKIARSPVPFSAKNEEVNRLPISPEVWTYEEARIRDLVPKFLSFCEESGVGAHSHDVAILARSFEIVKKIGGITLRGSNLDPWNDIFTRELAESRYLFDEGDHTKAFVKMEKAVYKRLTGTNRCTSDMLNQKISEVGFTSWRTDVYALLNRVPPATGLITDWVAKSQEVIEGLSLARGIQLKSKTDRGSIKYSSVTFDEVFGTRTAESSGAPCRIATVHSVKGETLDAVLLVLKSNAGNRQPYSKVLKENILENEELRIVYVAATRARSVLVFAVPPKDKSLWLKFVS
jgi:superfamily I DNA/RNA helicase